MKSKFLELCNDHMTRIVSLVHVGVMLDTRELKYKLEEMELGDLQVIIPTLTKRELDNYGDDIRNS